MEYRLEIMDPWGKRVAVFDESPLLEAERNGLDAADRIRGLLPATDCAFGPGYRVRVAVEGVLFCEGRVTWTGPAWGDTRKLVNGEYVSFREIAAFEAEGDAYAGNAFVARTYVNRDTTSIAKDLLNSAPGPVHYTVTHGAYPEGAESEMAKFLARRHGGNALEVGGIASGQWAGAGRIDASGAWAKDGRTIAGLVVDGVAWPDLRLLMVESEEMTLNARAIALHPETAAWTAARYASSGYKLRADAARELLQEFLDTSEISDIELNPHLNTAGAYDFRVDDDGCYMGLVYAQWFCQNAAMVEQGVAGVTLHGDGTLLPPEMALKEYYSYRGTHVNSLPGNGVPLAKFQARGGVLEALCALAYLAGGHAFALDPELTVRFGPADRVDRVLVHDGARTNVRLGGASAGMVNVLRLRGNPLEGALDKEYVREESVHLFGEAAHTLDVFALSHEADADRFAPALLDDLAYPEQTGEVTIFGGEAALAPGDLLEVRGEALRRADLALPGEWGGALAGKLAGRVYAVRHRFSGRKVETAAWLTSPLRSVRAPLAFMTRGQESAARWFEFRLDDAAIGLDAGWHLD